MSRRYRRLGSRYPRWILFFQLQFVYIVAVGALVVFSLYLDPAPVEFARLLVVAVGLSMVYCLVYLARVRSLIAPLIAWCDGARTLDGSIHAWRAAASLPRELLRREFSPSSPLALSWVLNLAWCLFAVWELDLAISSIMPLYVAMVVYMTYTLSLRFFAAERAMRPLLGHISGYLPRGEAPEAPAFPLRVRLLVTLPAINVITAVIVDAVHRGGHGEPGHLVTVPLIASAVAATGSLPLTVLLSDSITAPITAIRRASERLGAGDFDARVRLTTMDEIGDLERSFNRMAAGLAERERIRAMFGMYLDPTVAEHVLKEGTNLEGEQVDVTVMFIDIRDFTAFAERSTAREVVAVLNKLFELAVPIVRDHGGHVDKFIGDGLLAVFGAPRREPDHADRALAAAIEIDRRVDQVFGGELRIGIGLNSGPVVAGNIGGAGRFDFSVIGDVVNVAARVEAATRQTGDTILIAENTKWLLSDRAFVAEERPHVPFKGKGDPVRLYATTRAKEARRYDR